MSNDDKMLRKATYDAKECMEMLGLLSPNTFRKLWKGGAFPQPLPLNIRARRWSAVAVHHFLDQQGGAA